MNVACTTQDVVMPSVALIAILCMPSPTNLPSFEEFRSDKPDSDCSDPYCEIPKNLTSFY